MRPLQAGTEASPGAGGEGEKRENARLDHVEILKGEVNLRLAVRFRCGHELETRSLARGVGGLRHRVVLLCKVSLLRRHTIGSLCDQQLALRLLDLDDGLAPQRLELLRSDVLSRPGIAQISIAGAAVPNWNFEIALHVPERIRKAGGYGRGAAEGAGHAEGRQERVPDVA